MALFCGKTCPAIPPPPTPFDSATDPIIVLILSKIIPVSIGFPICSLSPQRLPVAIDRGAKPGREYMLSAKNGTVEKNEKSEKIEKVCFAFVFSE